MEEGSDAYKIGFLLGQVHAHSSHCDRASRSKTASEVGLAKIEISPVTDAAVAGYQ